MYEHPNAEFQQGYNLGWEKAIEMVISVVDEMMDREEFDMPTLDELAQRIV